MQDEWAQALDTMLAVPDALSLNEYALRLGVGYAKLKNEAADKEAHRTVLRARIEQRLKESGEATSDKAAERKELFVKARRW